MADRSRKELLHGHESAFIIRRVELPSHLLGNPGADSRADIYVPTICTAKIAEALFLEESLAATALTDGAIDFGQSSGPPPFDDFLQRRVLLKPQRRSLHSRRFRKQRTLGEQAE